MSSGTDIYHEMIVDYSRNPVNYGEIEDHDVTFHDSNPLCGDSIDIDMKIDDQKVSDIKFHGKGCAICMACLLYTSPSPRDATLSRMPSSA